MKNVGDLTLLSGKRITIKKNGTVYWSFQNLKKLDVSALTKLSSVLDDDLSPLGQSAEKKKEFKQTTLLAHNCQVSLIPKLC